MTWQFFYWGPLLFHTTILPGHLKKLRSRSGGGGNLFGGLLNKSLLGLGLFSAGGIIPQLFPNTVKLRQIKILTCL